MKDLSIQIDDLSGKDIANLLQEHLDDMRAVSPPESKHALDLEGLKQADITFWSLYENDKLVGCGALKELNKEHGEIKSMRVRSTHQGKGFASYLLEHIIKIATDRNYKRLSLETGSMDFFKPARRLYLKYGFIECEPFGEYVEDFNSVFMSKNHIPSMNQ